MELNSLGRNGSPYSREIQGAGIGLPLSKRFVELRGGALEMESELGMGTTVTARFPLERVGHPS
jgi:signal transduction histidine kinase